MAGRVKVDGTVCDKVGTLVSEDAATEILTPANPFVSRGGLKLAGALDRLSINVEDLTVLDVGASTGGFTDCLLQKGARFVYALDVGYGQLDWKLRNNPKVAVMERANIRLLKPQDLPAAPDLAVVDVSFISLILVIPVLFKINIPRLLLLVKPQFEVGRAEADRGGGVIRSSQLHSDVLREIITFLRETGYCVKGVCYSSLPGPKGNIEFFIYAQLRADKCSCSGSLDEEVASEIEQAHSLYNK